MELHLVPTLLGAGDNLHGLTLVRTVATPDVVHLEFVRR